MNLLVRMIRLKLQYQLTGILKSRFQENVMEQVQLLSVLVLCNVYEI
jgi:hypothetical protein